jgi:predicted NAD/FAD-binding protein
MDNNRVAIVGTGISGLTCGYYLHRAGRDVTLYEAADYTGGHTHTVDVEYLEEQSRIDTGFIVFNDRTYPHFIEMLEQAGVGFQPTEMSFSVRNDDIGLEYNGNNLNTLFAQRSNLISPRFWRMLFDIVKFNKDVRRAATEDGQITIGEYLAQSSYSALFSENYLLPMISAIWSMGLASCNDFPLHFFVRFFENHGLLDITNRPQWYTIEGGSSSYIEPLTRGYSDKILLNSPVRGVKRTEKGVEVQSDVGCTFYDQLIFACHANQALAMLEQPSPAEQEVLGNFQFSDNQVILHTDRSLLPERKTAWASWNYQMIDAAQEQSTLTYNMNILQRLNKKHTYLVSLNQEIDESLVIDRFNYSHPIYTTQMITAQEQWQRISGIEGIHYCGAYWFSGFHEDGVRSGLRVVDMLEKR